MKQKCYFCSVRDPNATPFSPKKHVFCLVCLVKLWEVAQKEPSFELREQIVTVSARPLVGVQCTVKLSTGYVLTIEDEEDFTHLFQAVFGEVFNRVRPKGRVSLKFLANVHDLCLFELHFVAGQLLCLGHPPDMKLLMKAFDAFWDDMGRKLGS